MRFKQVSILGFILLFFAILFLPADQSYPENLTDLIDNLPDAYKSELFLNGEISKYYSGKEIPKLIPGNSLSSEIRADLRSINANVGVEALFLFPLNGIRKEREVFFTKLLNISGLKGLEYYSASRKRVWPLFEQSYSIDNPDSGKEVPDPVIDSIPNKGVAYIFQKDTTFGSNISRLDYLASDNVIRMTIINMTPYKYGIIRIIRPANMHLHVAIYLLDDYLLYYGTFGARSGSYFLFEKKIHKSFLNRLKALFGWYSKNLKEE